MKFAPSKVLFTKYGISHEDGQSATVHTRYADLCVSRLVGQKFQQHHINILVLETFKGETLAFGATPDVPLDDVLEILRRHGVPVDRGWGPA